MKENRKGFTLVEIMAVVAVIGILAVIAIPSFIKSRAESWKNACIANMKQIESAVEQARMAGISEPAADDIFGATAYIKALPTCPCGTATYVIPTGDARPVCPNNVASHVLPAP